jgi:hypothetical protein
VKEENSQTSDSGAQKCSLWNHLCTYFRKHDFDLDHPAHMEGIEASFPYRLSWPVYSCKKCGKTMSLNRWQMEDLPFDMAHGCSGTMTQVTDCDHQATDCDHQATDCDLEESGTMTQITEWDHPVTDCDTEEFG